MAELKWEKRLETGIEIIDDQHRELFRRIDSLELSLYGGKPKVEVVMMIEYLATYVEEHFDSEEDLLIRVSYPDLSRHRREHDEFRGIYKKIKNEYDRKGSDSYLAIDVDKEIRKWWEKHILKSDMDFAPYVKEKR